MEGKADYKLAMTEIISKQSIILGPEIAVMRARGVHGLVVTDEGAVADIEGDPKKTMRQLVGAYVELSGQIVHTILSPIFEKYSAVEDVREV